MSRPSIAKGLAAAALVASLGLGGGAAVDLGPDPGAFPAGTSGFADAAFFPHQSLGDRGTDVRALQYLLNAQGYTEQGVTGYFGTFTEGTVKAFQADQGLDETGVVDTPTWERLILTFFLPGTSGDHVRALQDELCEKGGYGGFFDLLVACYPEAYEPGTYGPATQLALQTFQDHAGISHLGIFPGANVATWRALLWHFERPVFDVHDLCSYSTGSNGLAAKWGTAAYVAFLEKAADLFDASGDGSLAVGDISLEHGGEISGHEQHEVGLEADIRLVREDSDQCDRGVTYCATDSAGRCRSDGHGGIERHPDYDWAGTHDLILALFDAAPDHLERLVFNDQSMIDHFVAVHPVYGARMVTAANHDNHLHVRYCEPGFPDPAWSFYAC